MKTFIATLLLVSLVAVVPAPAEANAGCKTLANGIYACGEVSDGVCGAGSGSGQATGSVQWKLVVYTNHGNAQSTFFGPAAALTATAPCWTDTCTTVVLYANDEVIASSMGICQG